MDGTREGDEAATLYVDLMKNCLTRTLFDQPYQPMKPPRGRLRRAVADAAQGWLGRRDLTIVRRAKVVPPRRGSRVSAGRATPKHWSDSAAWRTWSSA